MAGCNVIDAIPQKGPCEMGCQDCQTSCKETLNRTTFPTPLTWQSVLDVREKTQTVGLNTAHSVARKVETMSVKNTQISFVRGAVKKRLEIGTTIVRSVGFYLREVMHIGFYGNVERRWGVAHGVVKDEKTPHLFIAKNVERKIWNYAGRSIKIGLRIGENTFWHPLEGRGTLAFLNVHTPRQFNARYVREKCPLILPTTTGMITTLNLVFGYVFRAINLFIGWRKDSTIDTLVLRRW